MSPSLFLPCAAVMCTVYMVLMNKPQTSGMQDIRCHMILNLLRAVIC